MRATRPRTRPRMPSRTIALVGCALMALPFGLSACGGSSAAPTTTSTTVSVSSTRCRLVTPAQIGAELGVDVAGPSASVHGTTTICTYTAANLSDSVIIGYDSAATTRSFTTDRAGLRRRGDKVGKILGLGDEAFYAVATTGGTTVTTVVARKGSEQVLVTGTATLTELETLAERALAEAGS
jgi:hypothetical protein